LKTCCHQIEHKQKENFVVVVTHTVIDPHTMMILQLNSTDLKRDEVWIPPVNLLSSHMPTLPSKKEQESHE
jgi:hypothetical protein